MHYNQNPTAANIINKHKPPTTTIKANQINPNKSYNYKLIIQKNQ